MAFLAGVAWGWAAPVSSVGLAWGAAASVLGILFTWPLRARYPLLARVLLLCSVCGLGATQARLDRDTRDRRARALVGESGGAVELQFRGRLLTTPEATADGSRSLVLRGAPERESSHAGLSTVRLTVRPSPPDATRALDAMAAGDAARVWCRLFRPRGLGNPGSKDAWISLAARGIDALGSVKSARLVERVRPAAGRTDLIDRVRRAARRRLDAVFAGRPVDRALAGAMLLGDRRAIDPRTWRVLRDAGLAHLVAISGLHVGLLAAAVLAVLRRSRLPALARLALVLVLLGGFGQLVGLRPSVLRAVLAASLFQIGRALGRDGDALNTLVLVACALVAGSPASWLDPGLQLTFAATAGILLTAARSACRGWTAGAVRVSGAAYLATAPLSAWHFGRLAPVCVVTNLAAVPLCAAVLAAGYGSMIVGATPVAGPLAAALARASTGALLGLARSAASVDAGAFAVPAPPLALVALYYAAALAALGPVHAGRGRTRIPRGAHVAAFALTALLIHLGLPPEPAPHHVRAAMIDVGQGQSIAVTGPRGGTVLFDAGGSAHAQFDPGERAVLPFVLRAAGRRIETLVLSHDDVDHAGGAMALLRELEIGELCLQPGHHASPRLRALAFEALRRRTAVRTCERGVELDRGGLRVSVLGPVRGRAPARGNDGSVVVLVGAAPYRLLIPGDLERGGEDDLLGSPHPLRAEALVVAHHGSRSGTSGEFLRRVGARVALVSCGYRNPFGHPHPDVVRRLRRAGTEVWRTDLDGMLRLDGRDGRWRVTGARR